MKLPRLRSALTALLLLLAAAAVGLLLPPLLARQAEPRSSELGVYEMEQIRLSNDQDLNLPEQMAQLSTYSHSFALDQGLSLDADTASACAEAFAADLVRLGVLSDDALAPSAPAPTLLVWSDGRTQICWNTSQTADIPFVSLTQSIDDSTGALLCFAVARDLFDGDTAIWPMPDAAYAEFVGSEGKETDESVILERLDALSQHLADCFRDRNALADCTAHRLETHLSRGFYDCTWEIRLTDAAGHSAVLTLAITPYEILWNPY